MSSKDMSNAIYKTTNQTYGWRRDGSCNPADKIRALKKSRIRGIDHAKFVQEFYKTTNAEFGSFGYDKNVLCTAVEDSDLVGRTKHVLPRGLPARPNEKHGTVDVHFDHYSIERKEEHRLYTTSANDIGAKKPKFPNKLHPHHNDFTKSFLSGMQRDCGLNTSVTKNRYIDNQ